VHGGQTRVRAGHPLVDNYPEAWQPAGQDLDYDIEDASAMPGLRRGHASAHGTGAQEAAVAAEQPKQARRFATGTPKNESKEGSK
jgi:hypothetical protein